jgi:hypothetical protein
MTSEQSFSVLELDEIQGWSYLFMMFKKNQNFLLGASKALIFFTNR